MTTDADIRDILDDYDACERQEFNLTVLVSTVARTVVKDGAPALLGRLPEKLREAVLDMAAVYERDGMLVFQSSSGRALHNELGSALVNTLRSSDGNAPS